MEQEKKLIKNPAARWIVRTIILLLLTGAFVIVAYLIGTNVMGFAFRDIINP